jgi:hypothetical protein
MISDCTGGLPVGFAGGACAKPNVGSKRHPAPTRVITRDLRTRNAIFDPTREGDQSLGIIIHRRQRKNVRKFLGGNPVKRHYSARERFGKKVQAPKTELSHTESKVVYFYTFS